MIGTLGEVSFNCSSEQFKTFKDLSISNSARVGQHDNLQGKPRLEFIAPGLDKVTLKLSWGIEGRVNSLEAIKPLEKARDEGEILLFMLGSKLVGSGRYMVTDISKSKQRIDNRGNVLSADFSITLQEYVVKVDETEEEKKSDSIPKKNVESVPEVPPLVNFTPPYARSDWGKRE